MKKWGFRFNKHASMELSINTIVILVIAIAVLGLGLAFTKNMFGRFAVFNVPAPEYEANSNEPIMITSDEIPLSVAKDTNFPIAIYNKCAETITLTSGTENSNPLIQCVPTTGEGIVTATVKTLETSIAPGSQKTSKFLVKLGSSAGSGLTICKISVKCPDNTPMAEKQFYGKIQS